MGEGGEIQICETKKKYSFFVFFVVGEGGGGGGGGGMYNMLKLFRKGVSYNILCSHTKVK